MAFPYKHVLMIGATSGIGNAMAERLILAGCKVTAVGRRQDRLKEFVDKHGIGTADSVTLDISQNERIPQFAADTMHKSPDIDCLFLNAGLQHSHDLSKPGTVNLKDFNEEIHVNYTSFVALTIAFLPYLQAQTLQASIIITGSNLAIVPAIGLSGYSASKAALNSFTLCLREELKDTNVKVLEISPPPVQTELHGPEGKGFGMPLDQFTELAYSGLISGEDEIVIGSVGPAVAFNGIIKERRKAFQGLAKLLRREV